MAAELEKIGYEEETAGAGAGHAAFEQGGHVMLDVVTSDDESTGLACAVQYLDLLFGQKPCRDRLLCQPFFLDRP